MSAYTRLAILGCCLITLCAAIPSTGVRRATNCAQAQANLKRTVSNGNLHLVNFWEHGEWKSCHGDFKLPECDSDRGQCIMFSELTHKSLDDCTYVLMGSPLMEFPEMFSYCECKYGLYGPKCNKKHP